MVSVQPTPSVSGSRVRIAISSPEILAHIRREFANNGLNAQIDGPPVVDVVVTCGPAAAPGVVALGDALNRLAGPDSYRRNPTTARYRLALAPNDQAGRSALDGRNAAGAPHGADGQRKTAVGPAHADTRSLSPREAEVMESISRGMRNADIAASLQVRQKTVKNHVNRIFTKLGVRTRVEAVLIWQGGTVAPTT
jgi:DNA-binding CsgD family transcriptional regulator